LSRLFIFIAMCFLLAVSPLFARDVEITVHDIELSLPLEGAVIRSWHGKQYICDRNGKSVVAVPDDRQVLIEAAYPGYESGRLLITTETATFTLGLRLSGIMESKELVFEAAKSGSSETKTGRSITISGRDIAQTGEIGIVEDVMKSIKLLPGVGYAGVFNAHPSIRGGDPGDMAASLNGFYIMNPYHWGGGFSIFDPRMVQSAQLSHGVFSSRYGHTISGLLDITAKKPSSKEMEFELGINTSAANFNFSLPFAGKGGLLFMGRTTYYDPIVWLMKQLSGTVKSLDPVNSIRVAPYIRSGTITGNYRFSDNLELQATGFWGMDGVGVTYENSSVSKDLNSDSGINFDWTNYQGFFTAGLSWNPHSDMLLKFSGGAGYEKAVIDGDYQFNVHKKAFSDYFKIRYPELANRTNKFEPYEFNSGINIKDSAAIYNGQLRIDYDWELKNGLLFAAGVQEMAMRFNATGDQQMLVDTEFNKLSSTEQEKLRWLLQWPPLSNAVWNDLRVSYPIGYAPDAENRHFTTSGYGLVEYHTPDNRFKTELGLRIDHFYLSGKGFSLQSKPAINPRLNVDFNVFQNAGVVQSFDLSAGTGLFSSINNVVSIAEERYNLSEIKPNRSWASILGARLEFPENLFLNVEGYYKYVFDRTYIPISPGIDDLGINPQFDGTGRVWGVDLMLQKIQSRYWDGWLSYSFSWAQYRDPGGGQSEMGISGGIRGGDWYFPQYHRFHNLNLVLNIRPIPSINIYTRFGLASGAQIMRRLGDRPVSYPVLVYNPDDPSKNYFIEKYYWPSVVDENNRTTPSLPLDIKFSIFGGDKKGKTRYELYVAVENVLALLYTAQGNTRFNQYTGEEETGSDSASYEIPFPIPSFGFRISY
jgi:hypothetical protein